MSEGKKRNKNIDELFNLGYVVETCKAEGE